MYHHGKRAERGKTQATFDMILGEFLSSDVTWHQQWWATELNDSVSPALGFHRTAESHAHPTQNQQSAI